MRIEVYTGVSKVGVLYRMLTLESTGQTPMSTRQQVEMIYSDYKGGFDGMVFISENENRVATGDNEFKFSDILDGFISYITGDYLPIDREDLILIIKNLEALTKDDKSKDLFKQLITAYNRLRLKLEKVGNNWRFEKPDGTNKRPFGYDVNEIFSKVQVIAGFGAALNFLIENKLLNDLEEILLLIERLSENSIDESLNNLIKNLDTIQASARKIGNEQRMYFYYFFRSLFNKSNDGFLDVNKSVKQAYNFYKANMLG